MLHVSPPDGGPPPLGLRQIWRFLLVGIVFHAVYILSIFDIYFRSPLIKDLPPTAPVQPAPAKRLVLFVGDGLRADKCFELDEAGRPRSPFLRQMARTRGAWGIAHTRVPTESRPGHVAMIAGFYEDVSAVTQGWKHNPVEFDHTLRRADRAWSFGAPDIVRLFLGERVSANYFPETMIDFAKDALELDRWSFDHLRELFQRAATDADLAAQLRSERTVIFVHLVGLDTNGHAFYPHSREYLENVSFVDRGVQQAVEMLDAFYGDDATAYLFTADHGMSDAGTHGDGDPDNTRCPLIVWGAGVDGPQPVPAHAQVHDAWSSPWGLDDIRRRDISQADLTPLMATLIGIPIPTNSEGVLPIEYLVEGEEGPKFKAQAALANLRQLAVSLGAREQQRLQQEPFFRPFRHPAQTIQASIEHATELIAAARYANAIRLIGETRGRVFEGIAYYQRYDWLLLRSVVALGYVFWMVYSIIYLARSYCRSTPSTLSSGRMHCKLVAAALGGLSAAYLRAKGAPLQYYLYFGFPIYFAAQSVDLALGVGWGEIMGVLDLGNSWHALHLYLLAMGALVLSFFNRRILAAAAPVVGLAMVRLVRLRARLGSLLLLGCFCIVSIFPTLQPIKLPNPWLLHGGALLSLLFGLSMAWRPGTSKSQRRRALRKLAVLALASGVTWRADYLFAAKQGLPIYLQSAAWIIFAYSMVGIFFQTSSRKASDRILDIFLTIAPAYCILSISYELLFFLAFASAPIIWIRAKEAEAEEEGGGGGGEQEGEGEGETIEKKKKRLRNDGEQTATATKTRRLVLRPLEAMMLLLAFKFISYFLLAFFGTGNFASISSFSLPSVYRLITVLSHFSMAALLLVKLFLPMVFLAASFGAVLRMLGVEGERLFLVVVGTMDVVTLSFFFLVRDQGSWLEIGTSISHFVLASVFSLSTLAIFSISRLLLRGLSA